MAVSAASSLLGQLRRVAPPLSAAIPITIFSVAAVALPLAAAQDLQLSARQTGAWLLALYGIPALLSLALTVAFRQPLFVAWHTAVVSFFASLAGEVRYADLLGATMVAGSVVAILAALGLTGRVADLVPAPVVFGVVAANVLPFVVGVFDALGDERLVVGGTFLAYVLGRWLLGPQVPPILPALLVGLVLAWLSAGFDSLPAGLSAPDLEATRPSFSLAAILTVTPVFVALTSLQANLTAVVYLRSQGYRPPARLIDAATGIGSMVAAFLGPVPVCMAALVTPLTAGPEAGEHRLRHWSVYAAGGAWILLALGAGIAADLPSLLPLPLLLAVAGLALVGVLAEAMGELTRGPLRLGPLFAFVIASSELSLLGLGPLFWALVLGTGVSLLLEAQALRELRVRRAAPA